MSRAGESSPDELRAYRRVAVGSREIFGAWEHIVTGLVVTVAAEGATLVLTAPESGSMGWGGIEPIVGGASYQIVCAAGSAKALADEFDCEFLYFWLELGKTNPAWEAFESVAWRRMPNSVPLLIPPPSEVSEKK